MKKLESEKIREEAYRNVQERYATGAAQVDVSRILSEDLIWLEAYMWGNEMPYADYYNELWKLTPEEQRWLWLTPAAEYSYFKHMEEKNHGHL